MTSWYYKKKEKREFNVKNLAKEISGLVMNDIVNFMETWMRLFFLGLNLFNFQNKF